jgi:hypothetical protein
MSTQKNQNTFYKTNSAIIDQLCEVSTHVGTYELLAEVFFEFALHEMENDPPVSSRIRQLRNIRYEVFQLFELARAAKDIKNRRKS